MSPGYYGGRSQSMTWSHKLRIVVGSAVILLVFGFFGYVLLGHKSAPPCLDIDTGCVCNSVPVSETIVLVDNTDSFSPSQVSEFQKRLKALHERLGTGGILTVASISGERPPDIVFSKCKPETGDSNDFLDSFKHPQDVQLDIKAAYERDFETPINELAKRMPLNRTTPYSPIIGSLEDVIDQSPAQWTGAGKRNLIIFSDLLENTKEFSQYKAGNAMTFAQARSSVPYIRDARLDLRKTEVTVYYLTGRATSKHLQNKAHERFWHDLVASYGGHITNWVRLPADQIP